MKDKLKISIASILFIMALFIKNNYISNILYLISYLIVGFDIMKKAWHNLWLGKVFDENFLMTIATLGAILIKEFPEAVCVMFFYQIGELFQDYATKKSQKSIGDLMNIRPDYANLYQDNKIKKTIPSKVKKGDIIIVKPGEKIPLDGQIIEGESSLDVSSLTGEAIPKEAFVNDYVLSGSINLSGVLKIKVTKNYNESTVSKILALLNDAKQKRANSEKFITKFAHIYTPIVCLIALCIAICLPLLTTKSFSSSLYTALTFLVVSCPCALVVSIPLSYFACLGGSSKMGILIKGSNYIENLTKVDTFVFDKTGTLTKGIFKVKKVVAFNMPKEELLQYALAAEYYSLHPLALALKKEKIDIKEQDIKKIKEYSGFGMKAEYQGKKILIGNYKLMEENKINITDPKEEGTILYCAIDNNYEGYIVMQDEIKEEAYQVINELENNNYKIIMLTGDKRKAGSIVAKALKIKEFYSDLLPQDKQAKIKMLLEKKSPDKMVAFVGDGINDAPSLATADVGISMGYLGSDSAIEAGDIVIMQDDLRKIPMAIKIAKKTQRIVWENIIFALGVKFLVLSLACFNLFSMWEAVFADVGVTILAIFNSLRVLNGLKKVI